MFFTLLINILSSNMIKSLIALGVNKLLEHKSDGITKDIAEVMLDSIAMSRANDAPQTVIDTVKGSL